MTTKSRFIVAAVIACLFLLMLIYVYVLPTLTSTPSSGSRSPDSRPVAVPANTAHKNALAAESISSSTDESKIVTAVEDLEDVRQDIVEAKLPQWQQVLDLTKAKVTNMPPPAMAATIAYVPDMNSVYHYVTSSVTKIGQGEMRTLSRSSLSFEKQPDIGVVITVDQEPGWIMADNDVVPYISPQQQRLMSLADGKLLAASQKDGTIVASDTPISQAEAQAVMIRIPSGLALKVGTRWMADTEHQGKGITWKVAGYALVNDERTVNIVSEWDNTDAIAEMVGKSSKPPSASSTKSSVYISLDTGIIVRSENTMTMTVNNQQSETQIITQLAQVISREDKND